MLQILFQGSENQRPQVSPRPTEGHRSGRTRRKTTLGSSRCEWSFAFSWPRSLTQVRHDTFFVTVKVKARLQILFGSVLHCSGTTHLSPADTARRRLDERAPRCRLNRERLRRRGGVRLMKGLAAGRDLLTDSSCVALEEQLAWFVRNRSKFVQEISSNVRFACGSEVSVVGLDRVISTRASHQNKASGRCCAQRERH